MSSLDAGTFAGVLAQAERRPRRRRSANARRIGATLNQVTPLAPLLRGVPPGLPCHRFDFFCLLNPEDSRSTQLFLAVLLLAVNAVLYTFLPRRKFFRCVDVVRLLPEEVWMDGPWQN